MGAPRSSTGSPQPALTKEATCTLEVTGLTNDPPIPVPAMAEKMHSFAQYMETSSTRSFIDSRQSHTDAPLSKFAALATTVAPITDMKARKKASNDDRLLRFRFRTHIGSAELLCGSRRKGNVAERPVHGENTGFSQNKTTIGERHRDDHHVVSAAAKQYTACRRNTHSGSTGNRIAPACQERRHTDGYRRADCHATQVGNRVRMRARRRLRRYEAAGVRVRRETRAAGTRRSHTYIQSVRLRLETGRRSDAGHRRSCGRFHRRAVGVVMLAGDARQRLSHGTGRAHDTAYAGRTAYRADR